MDNVFVNLDEHYLRKSVNYDKHIMGICINRDKHFLAAKIEPFETTGL